MELDLQRSPIVVLGPWNRAILNPRWVAQELGDGEIESQLGLQPDTGDTLTSYLFPEFELRVLRGQLSFVPRKPSPDSYTAIERIAVRLLGKLNQTPVSAFGINFGFRTTDLDTVDTLAAILHHSDETAFAKGGWSTELVGVTRRLSLEGLILNLQISRGGEQPIALDLNFHHPTASADEARMQLEGRSRQLLDRSVELLATFYGLRLEAR